MTALHRLHIYTASCSACDNSEDKGISSIGASAIFQDRATTPVDSYQKGSSVYWA